MARRRVERGLESGGHESRTWHESAGSSPSEMRVSAAIGGASCCLHRIAKTDEIHVLTGRTALTLTRGRPAAQALDRVSQPPPRSSNAPSTAFALSPDPTPLP